MKTVVNVFLAAAIAAASFASVQKSYGQINIAGKECVWGVRAGVNFSKLGGDFASSLDIGGELGIPGMNMKIPAKMKPGIQLGVVVSYPFNEKLTFQPGIIFAQQGIRWKKSGSEDLLGLAKIDYKVDTKMTLNYLQFPVNIMFRHDLNSSAALLLQAGPYLGMGLGGKMKMDMSVKAVGISQSESEEAEINFGSDKDKHDLKMFDLGLGIGAGVLFIEKIHFSVGYNLGLADIGHYVSTKNKGAAITLAYMFGK